MAMAMAAIRVFCAASTFPSVRDCLGFAAGAGEGVLLAIDTDESAALDPDSPDWSAVRLVYREDASLLTVAVLRDTDDAPAFRDTLDRFTTALATSDAPDAAAVRDYLTTTRAIVAVTLPTDAGDDALEAAAWFTRIFVEKYDGLLQADGEGFYDEDNDLLVALP